MKVLCFSFSIIVLFVVSCSNSKKDITTKEIYIDFANIQTIDLSEEKEIKLEFSDSSIIRSVDELRIYNKTQNLLRSRSDLFHYDKNGNFKNKIGRKGNGPMEFTSFSSFFVKNDLVYIYDFMSKKVLLYDFEGKHHSTISLKEAYQDIVPNYIYPIQDNQYISKNTFGGDQQQTPSYGILNDNFSIVSNIQDRYIKNGITVYNNFFQTKTIFCFGRYLTTPFFQ